MKIRYGLGRGIFLAMAFSVAGVVAAGAQSGAAGEQSNPLDSTATIRVATADVPATHVQAASTPTASVPAASVSADNGARPGDSHVRIVRRRCTRTFGLTDEIADCIGASNESGASRPARNHLVAKSGNVLLRTIGARRNKIIRRQPQTGLLTNPVQRTKPLRFEGPRAAHRTARGAENDSATRTNGAKAGKADRTMGSNSVEERH